jgi:hypothetical protein
VTHGTEALNSKNFELDPTHMGPQNLKKKIEKIERKLKLCRKNHNS